MVIEVRVIESQRESASAPWEQRVIDASTYTIEGPESDRFGTHVIERSPRGEALRTITFDAVPVKERS